MNGINAKDWIGKTMSITTKNGNQYKGTIKQISIFNGEKLKIKIESVEKLLNEEWKSTCGLEISFDLHKIGYANDMIYLTNENQTAIVYSPNISDRTLKNKKSGSFFI